MSSVKIEEAIEEFGRAVDLRLPFPPSSNRLWQYGRGRCWRSPEYNVWLEEAGLFVNRQRGGRRVTGPFKLQIQAIRPDKRKRDIDNIIAPICDLLQQSSVIENDCLCELVTARWVTQGEGVMVRVEPAGVE